MEQLAASEAGLAAAQRRAAVIEESTRAEVEAIRAAYMTAREARIALEEGARPQEIGAAKASLESAGAQVNARRALRKQLVVRAPTDGTIEDIAIRVGDVVPPGTAIATVIPEGDPYLRIYVPQRSLGTFALGKHVHVRSDAYPSRTFDGHVEQIDRRAQFLPRDVQTPEDRADVDFGVKVRVADPQRLLRSGTTAEVLP
jgi:multidrug resistance efflux pump